MLITLTLIILILIIITNAEQLCKYTLDCDPEIISGRKKGPGDTSIFPAKNKFLKHCTII